MFPKQSERVLFLIIIKKKKVEKRSKFKLTISPLAIQEFSQFLLLSSIIGTEFTKLMYIWAHVAFSLKTLIPLKNPPATTVF